VTTTAAPGFRVHDRYGDDALPPLSLSNETLAVQVAHRSVRSFLPDPVPEEHLEAMVAAAQSAPTSSNLQAWSVVAVRNRARKSRLATLAAEQGFVDEAPLLLLWLADLGRSRRLAERRGRPLDGADYLESTFLGFLDATLAAQNAVVAAESLGLGTVCVGAIRNHPEEVACELDLPPHVFAVFGLAVGWPDPAERAGVKPRLPQSAVLHRERYDAPRADAAIDRYDERLRAYNRRHGLTGDWTERVVHRLEGAGSLAGRDRIREALVGLGLPSR
jgi:nitroreductase